MWASRYWADRMFAPRYWAKAGATVEEAKTHRRRTQQFTTAPAKSFDVRRTQQTTTKREEP